MVNTEARNWEAVAEAFVGRWKEMRAVEQAAWMSAYHLRLERALDGAAPPDGGAELSFLYSMLVWRHSGVDTRARVEHAWSKLREEFVCSSWVRWHAAVGVPCTPPVNL